MKTSFPASLLLALYVVVAPALPVDSIIDTATRHAPADNRSRNFESLEKNFNRLTRIDPIEITSTLLPDTVLDKRAHAHALLQQVLSGQRFLESLDALSEIELPVGIVKSGGELDYTILVDRISFSREGAVMDVYVSLALPQTGARVAFHGIVPLSAEGGVAGTARVFLLGDHTIKLNDNTLVSLKADRSYVEFDCTGFLGVALEAELQFSKDLLVPEDAHGGILNERLRVLFTAQTQSLHDILIELTLPPFQVTGLHGFGFHVTKAYLDWSDLVNPPQILFPEEYPSPLVEAGLPDLWQGIYLEELEIRLPPAFVLENSNERLSIGARHMIIDDLGVTGEVYVENIFNNGNMNGWAYSLDTFELALLSNSISGFRLAGDLSIPVVRQKNGEHAAFEYVAQRSTEGDYIFSVAIQNELKLDLWLAEITLMPGSRVIVTEKSNKFYPSAHLSGELAIKLEGKGPKAVFNAIRFENMVISSEAPHFRPGTFGFGREGHASSIAGYPLVFDNITLRSEDRRVGLAFDMLINISGKPDDESFAGKAGMVVWGILDDAPDRNNAGMVTGVNRHNWKFQKVELTSVKINIKKPKLIELAGEVRFYDSDRIYGEGFKGSLKGKIHTIKVEAEALFGKTETFRYWYADALVELETGVPIIPGVLSAFGFGGGYYSKMKQSDVPIDGTLGRSPSGITYVPDDNTVGIRAIVLIGTPRPEAMRGDVQLEVSVNRHGGVNAATFTGNLNFMSTISGSPKQIREMAAAAVAGNLTEKLESLKRGQVYGSVTLHFDNVNDIFHGNLEIFVNVAGGIVRGAGGTNRAGWAVLHFESNNWYVHIGTPDKPLGLEVARIFQAKSYFMFGKNLPGSPPPPAQVSEILGNVDMDYMRDLNALESGTGIAFGLHFLVDTGDLRFLMFYGRFSAGTGLDFMLKDYGNEYHCAGTSGPMGINGWYANGQAYAFVMGKIGIKINLRFYKGKYEILSIGAAAILQAKGPNPFWMKGQVGGYYRILGGLVKGRCKFEVTVGTECKPVGEQNLLEEVNMIADIAPGNSSSDVSVFNAPQVVFNIPVGEVFEIADMEKKTHHFRATLDEFTLTNDGRAVQGTLVWNHEKNVVIFDPADVLPGHSQFMAHAKLTFEERRNGLWSKVKFDGKIVTEDAETNFRTGQAPDVIPESNIAWSYPVAGQLNFHPNEFSQGLIQLLDGQPDLFTPRPGWNQKVRITDAANGDFFETSLKYAAPDRRVVFPVPGELRPARVYNLQIVNTPSHETPVDENVHSVERNLNIDETAGTATLTTQSAAGHLNMLEDQELLRISFRTSRYRTFREKMQNITLTPAIRLTTGINIFQLTAFLKGDEFFDEAELQPAAERLIHMEAVLEGNTWYHDYADRLVYAGYPLLGWMKVKRSDPEKLGVPPVRDILISNAASGPYRDSHIDTAAPFTNEALIYNLGQSVASDFFDLRHHAVNYLADYPSRITPRLEALILQPLPYIRQGLYKIRFRYSIPGIQQTTSTYDVEMFNPIPDND